jgi:hypothetical protein
MKIFLLLCGFLICLIGDIKSAQAQAINGVYVCEKQGSFHFYSNRTVAMLDSSGKSIITLRYEVKDKLILISGPHADIKLPILADGTLEFKDGIQAPIFCKKQSR